MPSDPQTGACSSGQEHNPGPPIVRFKVVPTTPAYGEALHMQLFEPRVARVAGHHAATRCSKWWEGAGGDTNGVRAVRRNEPVLQLKLHATPCVSPTDGVGRQFPLSVGHAGRQARDELPRLVRGVVSRQGSCKASRVRHRAQRRCPDTLSMPTAMAAACKAIRSAWVTINPTRTDCSRADASCATREPAAWLNSAHRQLLNCLCAHQAGQASAAVAKAASDAANLPRRLASPVLTMRARCAPE